MAVRQRVSVIAVVLTMVFVSGLTAHASSYSYYLPYFVKDGGEWTGVAFRNSSYSQQANAELVIYGQSGNSETENITLPPAGQTSYVAGSGEIGEGWIRVNSDQPLYGLCFFGDTSGTSHMADIPLASELAKNLIVPHVAQNAQWDTRIMICNPNGVNAAVTLTFRGQNGVASPSVESSILADGSEVYELADLTGESSEVVGSVEISSDQGIAAFALYNDLKSGGANFAGINAVIAGNQSVTPSDTSETEPNDNMGEADSVGIGYSNPIVSASLASEDDVDYYKFDAEAGRTYVIETFNILANSSNNATGIYLYDANGMELVNDKSGDNGTNDANARITHTFVATGTYYILVKDRAYNDWTGSYSLRILPKHDEPGSGWDTANDYEPNDALVLANHIDIGYANSQTHSLAPHSGYVTNKSDYDWYRFSTEAGRTYVIETFGILANSSNNATGIYLYDANGVELVNDKSGNNGTNDANARITHTFVTAGTYYVLVKDDFNYYSNYDWTGSYSLRILPKHDEPGAGWDTANDYEPNDALVLANHIDIGYANSQTHSLAPHSGYVTNKSDYDWYYFNVEAGRTYVIETFDVQTDSSGNATGIWLYDANGVALADDEYGSNGTNNANARMTHTFIAAGTYYVLVKDYFNYSNDDWTGSYSLRILPQD